MDCGQFTTPGAGIESESVSDVATTSATLNATINPNRASTRYYFQYGRTSAYEHTAPAPSGASLGSAEGEKVSQHIQENLSPGTTYHYRVVAPSDFEHGVFEVAGEDHVFTTQSVGETLPLLDGRRWELVSPPRKKGALLTGLGYTAALQASAVGNSISYFAFGATETQPQATTFGVQVFSKHGPSGWSSQDIGVPHSKALGVAFVRGGGEYFLFSEDCRARSRNLAKCSSTSAADGSQPRVGSRVLPRSDRIYSLHTS